MPTIVGTLASAKTNFLANVEVDLKLIKLKGRGRGERETLESVSSCTRFSGLLTISSFGFNCLSSKLVSLFFGIVPMFVPKDCVSDCFVAQICANYGAHAHFGANLRDEAILNKIL